MFCSKCNYTSFDHLTNCPKCGYDWGAERRIFNVEWVQTSGDSWMFSSQDKEAQETEISEDSYQDSSMEISSRTDEAKSSYQSFESQEAEGDGSEFSLDLGKELEPDDPEAPDSTRTDQGARVEDEIEFPDLDIGPVENNEK